MLASVGACVWGFAKVGALFKGVVTAVKPYGVFVDLGGVSATQRSLDLGKGDTSSHSTIVKSTKDTLHAARDSDS